MSGHTPGPWAAQLSDSDPCAYEVVQAFEGGSVVAGEYGIDSTDDARLIAAAPELLEALELCTEAMANSWARREPIPLDCPQAAAAYAAIAKATGGTP